MCSFWDRIRYPWGSSAAATPRACTIRRLGRRANGGIFKTTDGGKTWKKLTTGLPAG